MSRTIDLESLTDRELVALHAATLEKLLERGTVRTRNAPTGDYAESLVAAAFDGRLTRNSAKGVDFEVADGRRFQVKSRRVIDPTRRSERQLSALRSFEFDDLVVVLFASDYGVRRAVLIPAEVVRDISRYSAHTNSWRVFADDALLDDSRCTDITARIRRAQ